MPHDLGAPKRSDCREGALVCSLVAAILAAIAIGLRTGFPDLLATTALRSLGLSWILIHFPWLLRLIVSRAVRSEESSRAWWSCDSLAMLIGLAAVAKGGWIAAMLGVSIGAAVLPIGGALVAARFAAAFVQRDDDERCAEYQQHRQRTPKKKQGIAQQHCHDERNYAADPQCRVQEPAEPTTKVNAASADSACNSHRCRLHQAISGSRSLCLPRRYQSMRRVPSIRPARAIKSSSEPSNRAFCSDRRMPYSAA